MTKTPLLPLNLFTALVAAAVASTPAPAQTPRYAATDLGDLPGGADFARPYALNNLGQVVGGSRAASPYGGRTGIERPFLWSPDRPNGATGSLLDLGLPAGPYDVASARGINDAGQVVGDAWNGNDQQPFLWTPAAPNGRTGTMTLVGPTPAAYHKRAAAAINDRGQVVGTESQGILPQHGFLWTPNVPNGPAGTLTDLGELPGGYDRGGAYAINARGQVTGGGDVATLPGDADAGYGARIRPFLWNPSAANAAAGAMTPLDVPTEYPLADASGINDRGQVVGRAMQRTGATAFVWTPDAPGSPTGSLQLLPGLDGRGTAEAHDINNLGQVVGVARARAFLWDEQSGMRDLNLLLDSPLPDYRLAEAVAVNDAGQIIARGLWSPDPDTIPIEHAFLLTPLPEPTGLIASASACAACLLRRRRTRGRGSR